MKRFATLISAVSLGAAALGAGGGAIAEERQNDMGGFTCRQVLLAPGDERDLTVVFLQGFFIGKSGGTTFDQATLARATDRFLDGCIDHPDDAALAVMERALKAVAETPAAEG